MLPILYHNLIFEADYKPNLSLDCDSYGSYCSKLNTQLSQAKKNIFWLFQDESSDDGVEGDILASPRTRSRGEVAIDLWKLDRNRPPELKKL